MAQADRRVHEMERERDNAVVRYQQMRTQKEKSDGTVLAQVYR
jgi:hypothetical protein